MEAEMVGVGGGAADAGPAAAAAAAALAPPTPALAPTLAPVWPAAAVKEGEFVAKPEAKGVTIAFVMVVGSVSKMFMDPTCDMVVSKSATRLDICVVSAALPMRDMV